MQSPGPALTLLGEVAGEVERGDGRRQALVHLWHREPLEDSEMKEHRYDDYGIDGLDLLGARVLVAEALGIELEERESGYYAGNYFCLRTGGTRPLMLYSNFDESS